MHYLLTVLTNGRRECFERALHAFAQHASPAPAGIMVMDDGGQTGHEFVLRTLAEAFTPTTGGLIIPVEYEDSPAPLGMCKAYAHCWHAAATSEHPWVFHLEDDFVLLRPLKIVHLAETIEAEPTLAQVALVRTPWGFEIPHGGYIPMFPGLYERRETRFVEGHRVNDEAIGPEPYVRADDGSRLDRDTVPGHPVFGEFRSGRHARWIATTRNWATNPALTPTDLMRRYQCPLENGCETAIGPMILADQPDAVFGLWGWGEPWAAHIGEHRQPGAFGYH